MRRIGLPVLFLATAALGAWALWPRAEVHGEPAPSSPDAKSTQPESLQWMGVASCASMACHHANGPRGSLRSEYSTWAGHDKHAQAFQVLYNDRSRTMIRNLYGEGKDVKPAHEQTLCLKCHAMGDGDPKATGPRFSFVDGVGCESCHGPAEKWLSTHYQDSFKAKSIAEKAEQGMWATKDLAVRAQICAGCHLGDAATGKEVNHDLYAAGHPRLNFEFSAYLAQYPKHWDVKNDKSRHPDYEARVWALGQVMCAQKTLGLLKDRADSAAKGGADAKPWPEFAEYDCFACHKEIKPNSPRQKVGFGERVPGSLPWGTWTWSTAEPLAAHMKAKVDLDSLKKLRKEMERPQPDPKTVSALAGSLHKSLDDWSAQVKERDFKPTDRLLFTVQLLLNDQARSQGLTWDEATQLYLALDALYQTKNDQGPGRVPPEFGRGLRDMRKELVNAFAPGVKGQLIESPVNFEPAKLQDPLRMLRTSLSEK